MRDRIHGQLLRGRYRPGDKMPRDEDLAAELGCARSTIQRAMRDLAERGLVERRRKGGTHVRRNPIARATFDIPIARHEVEARGASYGYQLIGREKVMAPAKVLADLGLARSVAMLNVQALHLADGRPFIYEDRWINLEIAPEIMTVDLAAISANEWLLMNKPFTRFDLRVRAIEASEALAQRLETRTGAAVLVSERSTWVGDAPVTLVQSIAAPGYQLVANS